MITIQDKNKGFIGFIIMFFFNIIFLNTMQKHIKAIIHNVNTHDNSFFDIDGKKRSKCAIVSLKVGLQ